MFSRLSWKCVQFAAIIAALLLLQCSMLWAQRCTTNPFDSRILPLCDPGGSGDGTTTVGPEDLLDFIQSANGSWQTLDVSALFGVHVLGAPPSAILVNGEYHIYVPEGTTGHLEEFIRSTSGQWSIVDLTAATGQSSSVSVPTAIVLPSGTEHVLAAGSGHLLDFIKVPGSAWTVTDVSVAVGLGSASQYFPNGHVAVILMGSDIHVYAFASGVQEYCLPSAGSWAFTDISGVLGSVQTEGSSMAALNLNGTAEVYIASSSGHILNFQGSNFVNGRGTWQLFDQTTNSGGSIIFAGFPYVSALPLLNGSSIDLFLDGGNSGVADLVLMVETNGLWQTSDLSTLAMGGRSLGLVAQPFALLDGSNLHAYAPGGGHLLEFFKQPSANWVVTDVSAITGKDVLGIASSGFRNPTTSEFHIFTNGANSGGTPNTLTVYSSPSGTGTATGNGFNCSGVCSQIFAINTQITLTATPASGYLLEGWTGCDSVSGATCSLTLASARNVTAIFGKFGPGFQASSDFADAQSWNSLASYYDSIRLADVNGDGILDVCGRSSLGVICGLGVGNGHFGAATQWESNYSDAVGWNQSQYGTTMMFADLNGDHKADVCGRGIDGIDCKLSTRSSFGTGFVATTDFSDAQSWNSLASYYDSIRLADVNGDGILDVCGRSSTGVICGLGTGDGHFARATQWESSFTDAVGWNQSQYGTTMMFIDLNGDGKADVCGRGIAGIICEFSTGSSFGPGFVATTDFSDAQSWNSQSSYYGSIRLADVNGDGIPDVCGRTSGGIVCALGTGDGHFAPVQAWESGFTDFWGWNQPQYGTTMMFGDLNGDRKADVCGRGIDGIDCKLAQ